MLHATVCIALLPVLCFLLIPSLQTGRDFWAHSAEYKHGSSDIMLLLYVELSRLRCKPPRSACEGGAIVHFVWSDLPAWLLRHVHGRRVGWAGGNQANRRLSNDRLRLRQQTTGTLVQPESERRRNPRRRQTRKSSSKLYLVYLRCSF